MHGSKMLLSCERWLNFTSYLERSVLSQIAYLLVGGGGGGDTLGFLLKCLWQVVSKT